MFFSHFHDEVAVSPSSSSFSMTRRGFPLLVVLFSHFNDEVAVCPSSSSFSMTRAGLPLLVVFFIRLTMRRGLPLLIVFFTHFNDEAAVCPSSFSFSMTRRGPPLVVVFSFVFNDEEGFAPSLSCFSFGGFVAVLSRPIVTILRQGPDFPSSPVFNSNFILAT